MGFGRSRNEYITPIMLCSSRQHLLRATKVQSEREKGREKKNLTAESIWFSSIEMSLALYCLLWQSYSFARYFCVSLAFSVKINEKSPHRCLPVTSESLTHKNTQLFFCDYWCWAVCNKCLFTGRKTGNQSTKWE